MMSKFRSIVNPANWPITVKIPMLVVLLMVVISAVITNRVLARLAETQQRNLEQLSSAYLDGLSTSLIPSVFRGDIWEVFDVLDRSRERYRGLNVTWIVVTDGSQDILASSEPTRFPSETPLPGGTATHFGSRTEVTVPDSLSTAYLFRPLAYQDREIGRIYAEADISPLIQERSEVFATLVLTNVLLTLVLAGIGYLAVRRMIEPVHVLSVHLDRGAQVRPVEPIPEKQKGSFSREFRRLFTQYNALARAVNEREEFAAKLAEEEKLASLGRLASGLAHEINNPLGGMFNALDALRRHGDRESVRATSSRLLEQGLLGIRDLVRSTLAVYRDEGSPRKLTPSDIDDLRLLIKPEAKRKTLTLHWNNDFSGPLNLPTAPVRDATLNLLLNACEACPDRGMVSLRTTDGPAELIVEVADDGPGLPPDIRDYLERPEFEPVPRHPRAGLGLWMVKRFCHEVGGRIEVAACLGGGTTIRMIIPFPMEEVKDVA